jgi:ABC-type branched-subunit amino acid transport system substrate-binding protein
MDSRAGPGNGTESAVDLLAVAASLGSARFASLGDRMPRQSFRVTVIVASLTTSAMLFTSGCTQEAEAPQAYRPPPPAIVETAPLPAPPPQPMEAPVPVQTPVQAITSGRAKVALLAPLSGPNKTVGQAMLDAADMALFDVSSDLALLPRDTGGTPDDARAAAASVISDGAALILGPVFSASVPPVREAARAFTTDATVAGGDVLVLGFLPSQQVERVVGFAKSRGMTKLAALVPDNSYGAAVTSAIGAIQGRLGLAPPRIITVGRDAKAQIAGLADDPPQMLLIALGGEQLIGLAPALADYAAAHQVQLLGTGLWDDSGLSRVPALAGGWYAAPVPDNFNGFSERFEKIYHYRPPRIATLAYDSVALATSIARNAGAAPNPFDSQTLLQPNGFVGIDGGFRFLPSGLSERNLAVLAVGPNGPVVVDPPPPGFEKLGE